MKEKFQASRHHTADYRRLIGVKPPKTDLIFELLVWTEFLSDFHHQSTKQNLKVSRREQKKNFINISIFGEVIQK